MPLGRQLAGELVLLVKYYIVKSLLQYNVKIGRKLAYLSVKYKPDDIMEKEKKINFKGIVGRFKSKYNLDKDIISVLKP